jgi:hypothetical protein
MVMNMDALPAGVSRLAPLGAVIRRLSSHLVQTELSNRDSKRSGQRVGRGLTRLALATPRWGGEQAAAWALSPRDVIVLEQAQRAGGRVRSEPRGNIG